MNTSKKSQRKNLLRNFSVFYTTLVFVVATGGAVLFVHASVPEPLPKIAVAIDPNLGVRSKVEAFFIDNEAPEMLPIIACESDFKHYHSDGSVLKNRTGSSATGVAQILASKHPDPMALKRFNQKFDTNLTLDTLDITKLEHNLGYALVLYELRGTRDWECAQLI